MTPREKEQYAKECGHAWRQFRREIAEEYIDAWNAHVVKFTARNAHIGKTNARQFYIKQGIIRPG